MTCIDLIDVLTVKQVAKCLIQYIAFIDLVHIYDALPVDRRHEFRQLILEPLLQYFHAITLKPVHAQFINKLSVPINVCKVDSSINKNDMLKLLQNASHLSELNMSLCSMGTGDLLLVIETLSNCSSIKELTLSDCKYLSQADLIVLGDRLKLRSITLISSTSAISEESKVLSKLINQDDIIELIIRCPHLLALHLDGWDSIISDRFIYILKGYCPDIVRLSLDNCGPWNDKLILSIVKLFPNIEQLKFDADVENNAAALLLNSCRVLRSLSLKCSAECHEVFDESCSTRISNLEAASFSGVTRALLNKITKASVNLHTLELYEVDCTVTDIALESLVRSCSLLTKIAISTTAQFTIKLSDAVISILHNHKLLKHVELGCIAKISAVLMQELIASGPKYDLMHLSGALSVSIKPLVELIIAAGHSFCDIQLTFDTYNQRVFAAVQAVSVRVASDGLILVVEKSGNGFMVSCYKEALCQSIVTVTK